MWHPSPAITRLRRSGMRDFPDRSPAWTFARAEGRRRARADRAARGLLKRLARHHDLVLVHDPELLVAAAGLRLRNLVWDVHEDASAALQVKEWMPKALRPAVAALWRAAEHQAERSFDLLLAEFAYQQRFRRRHPVIPNTVQVPTETVPPGRDRVVYLGTVTEARGCQLMIAVGRALAALPSPVRLEIIGDAPQQKSAEALHQAERAGSLTWRGFLPSRAALSRISGALAGLSLLDDLPNFRCSLPTKVVEYGAFGIPVIDAAALGRTTRTCYELRTDRPLAGSRSCGTRRGCPPG